MKKFLVLSCMLIKISYGSTDFTCALPVLNESIRTACGSMDVTPYVSPDLLLQTLPLCVFIARCCYTLTRQLAQSIQECANQQQIQIVYPHTGDGTIGFLETSTVYENLPCDKPIGSALNTCKIIDVESYTSTDPNLRGMICGFKSTCKNLVDKSFSNAPNIVYYFKQGIFGNVKVENCDGELVSRHGTESDRQCEKPTSATSHGVQARGERPKGMPRTIWYRKKF